MTQFHWNFYDDDSPFPELGGDKPERRSIWRHLIPLVCLTALVGVAIGHDNRAAERAIHQQIQSAGEDSRVETVSLRGNIAVARVIQVDSPGVQEKRTTRFLVQSDGSWYTSDPHPSFWGEQRERKTAHFHFLYRALDAESVESLATEVESLYSALLYDLGLSNLPKQVFVVEVVPEEEPAIHPSDHHWLRVASPHLRLLPAEQSGRDFLARRLGDWLSSRLLAQHTARPFTVAPNARFVLDCLRRSTVDRWAPPDPTWLQARRHFLEQALVEKRWRSPERFDRFLLSQRDREARLFQCSAVAEFIAKQHGPGGLAALVYAMQHEPSWSQALESSLGLSYEKFLARWLSWIEMHIVAGSTPAFIPDSVDALSRAHLDNQLPRRQK